MGKVETRRFERNWTTFVNPAFCAAWKGTRKMLVWNRPGLFRFQGCLFASPRWGKSKQGVLNAFWTTFVNPAFCAAWKSPPKTVVWNRPRGIRSQGCLFAPPRWGKSKKGVLNAFWTTFVNPAFWAAWKSPPKLCYETDLVQSDPKGVYSLRPDGESRNKAFWTQLDDLRQPGFLRCLEKPTQNAGMKTTWWNSILRVFISFAQMGKVETRRIKRNWKTFVNPAFCAAW